MDELEQLKQQVASLTDQLKKFEGIDPDTVTRDRTSLSEQLSNTQRQFNEFKQQSEAEKTALQKQLQQKDVDYHFRDQLASAGVLPEYRDRFNDLAASLQYDADKLQTSGGEPFDVASLRDKYPAMFAPVAAPAGSGATGSNATPTSNQPKVVNPSNGVISGVDPAAILDGSVVIK